ncbi:MAG: cation:proton antiporter [bacterium]
MITLNHNEVIILLLQLSILLIFARFFGELSRMLKQPAVIGEIIAGVILGPSLLGYIFPKIYIYIFQSSQNSFFALDGISSIGLILLLFVAGMELELSLIIKNGKTTSILSFFGVVFPFLVGFFAAWFFYDSIISFDSKYKLIFSLFFGTALSIPALSIIAKILLDLNLLKTKVGSLILSVAMVDDLIGWILFSIILSMMAGTASLFNLPTIIITTLVFIAGMLTLGRAIIDRIIPVLKKYISGPSGIIAFSVVLCLLGSLFTQYIGIHSIFGAFIIGVAVGNSEHFTHESREIIHQFTASFFAPLFFVMIGLKIDFIQNFNLNLVLFVMVFSFATKIMGVWFGSYYVAKLPKFESLAVSFGLNARGTMAIFLGIIALEAGVINQAMFVAIIIMTIITSITSGSLLSHFVKRIRAHSLKDIITNKLVFFSSAITKDEIIKELCAKAAKEFSLNEKEIYLATMQRENLASTGLQNHLALPHAKLNIPTPVIVLAISKQGIDFDSLDELPAKLFILLLTPLGENNLQLSFLAEIAKTFHSIEVIEKAISLDDAESVVKTIKESKQ